MTRRHRRGNACAAIEIRLLLMSLAASAAVTACASSNGGSTGPASNATARTSISNDAAWSAPALERALSVRDGRTGLDIELKDLFDRLAQADVVFLGETHTDETTHRLELATYEALLARRGNRVVLAMEMFERDEQAALDEYLSGKIDEATFLAQTRPWSNYASAYRPLIERAKKDRLSVVASNFPTPLRRRVSSGGADVLAQLSADERKQAPAQLLPETSAYWRRVDNAIRGHIGMMGPAPAADDPRLTDTQSLWDNCMGESCARALDDHPGACVLHVNGGFHSAYWDGTVRQLLLRKPQAHVLTVAIEPSSNPTVEEVSGKPIADFVVFAEARAKDVDDGQYAVVVPRELKYRLHVPKDATASTPLPLLIWLGDDGSNAEEGLDEWRERLGDACAIVAIEAPDREMQDDLVEGGRWFHSDTFSEDVGALVEGVERTWAYVARHFPVDPERVCLAGDGTGATITAATALLAGRMSVHAIALGPRRFADIKDFPLPLPELEGDGPRPHKSLEVFVKAGDETWWSSETEAYRGIGLASELATATSDVWRTDLDRENAVRAGLGLEPRALPAASPRRFIVAEGPRASAWARRIALKRGLEKGELVAVVAAPPPDVEAKEIPTAVHATDFRTPGALPMCPGGFGGTTIVVMSDDMAQDEVDAWLALEKDDPLAAHSRFHRLRIATGSGDHALAKVLEKLSAEKRKNVLIVPATFCADGATMRALQGKVRDWEDKMTIAWRPGLGG
jgi:uncharacterized iron-regulated protein/predicted esterase